MSSPSSSLKICYNSECREVRSDTSRKAWRLRSGEFAELCNRCATAYEEGRYCDTVHSKSSGWRSCESCGKRVHCGCIVSVHAFILLDAGGIECMTCAKKNIMLTTNSMWPPPSLLLPIPISDRLKDMSIKNKNWTQISGAGPVPWRQAPSLFNTSISQSEMHPRTTYDVDISSSIDRLNAGEKPSISSPEKKKLEDMNGILKIDASEILENRHSGMNCKEQLGPHATFPRQMSSVRDDLSTSYVGLSVLHASANENNGQTGTSGTHLQPTPLPFLTKKYHGNIGGDSSGEVQIRNGRTRGEGRGKNQLLSRYWPRITNQELQQLSREYPWFFIGF